MSKHTIYSALSRIKHKIVIFGLRIYVSRLCYGIAFVFTYIVTSSKTTMDFSDKEDFYILVIAIFYIYYHLFLSLVINILGYKTELIHRYERMSSSTKLSTFQFIVLDAFKRPTNNNKKK